MLFDIITDYEDQLDSCVVTLEEAQVMFPGFSRTLSHAVPGTRIRVSDYAVAYCVLDTETKPYYEL